jgi:hypothetical protein
MQEKVRIYTLSDKAGDVFYVGCTTKPINERLISHINEARVSSVGSKKNEKIAELGYEVLATLVEIRDIEVDQWGSSREKTELEYLWINKYRALGYSLTNIHPILKDVIHEVVESEYVGLSLVNTPKGIREVKK